MVGDCFLGFVGSLIECFANDATGFEAAGIQALGFTPQMTGVMEYVESNPDTFDAATKAVINERLARKKERLAVPGNSWQNVFPTNIRAYQDWWSRVQAA